MKQIVLGLVVLFAMAESASAQQAREKTSTKKDKVANSLRPVDSTDLIWRTGIDSLRGSKVLKNNRRIYHWKNGQRSTPTGHEATGVGSGYSALKKRPLPLAKDTVPPRREQH